MGSLPDWLRLASPPPGPEPEIRLRPWEDIEREIGRSDIAYCLQHLRERGMHREADVWQARAMPIIEPGPDGS